MDTLNVGQFTPAAFTVAVRDEIVEKKAALLSDFIRATYAAWYAVDWHHLPAALPADLPAALPAKSLDAMHPYFRAVAVAEERAALAWVARLRAAGPYIRALPRTERDALNRADADAQDAAYAASQIEAGFRCWVRRPRPGYRNGTEVVQVAPGDGTFYEYAAAHA